MAGATEATITQYGLENPAQAQSFTIVEAYSTPGYIVKVYTTEGQMTGCNTVTSIPDGYTILSTVPATSQAIVNLVEGSALPGQYIGVQALIPGQTAYLHLAPATVAVAIGDLIGPTTTQGCVSPRNATGLTSAGIAFAKALEQKGANAGAGAMIKVRIIAPVYLAAGVYTT